MPTVIRGLSAPPPNPSCPTCLWWLRAAAANEVIRMLDTDTATLTVGECADLHRRAQAGEFDELMQQMLNPLYHYEVKDGTVTPAKKS